MNLKKAFSLVEIIVSFFILLLVLIPTIKLNLQILETYNKISETRKNYENFIKKKTLKFNVFFTYIILTFFNSSSKISKSLSNSFATESKLSFLDRSTPANFNCSIG